MSSEELWDQALTDRVGRQLRRTRGARSAQWLAARTAELGFPIGRATISELETGRRKSVTVSELLVLAAALDVSPVALLYGEQLIDGVVELVPGVRVSAARALLWHSGYDLSPTSADGDLVENYAVRLVYDLKSTDAALTAAFKAPNTHQSIIDIYLADRESILGVMKSLNLIVDEDAELAGDPDGDD